MQEPTGSEAQAIVGRLAAALDADDFTTALGLLAEDCVYRGREDTSHGAEAILASYADASAWAHRTFDEVRYASETGPAAGDTVTVTFTDYLLKAGGRWHRYRCTQEFTIGRDGKVARIVHRDLPGEREALDAYFRECGIER